MDRKLHTQPLIKTLILTGSFFFVEIIGGLLTNSLALLSDAGHMLTDVGAVALSLIAIKVGERSPTPQNTYGFYRAEILAALFNGLTLVSITGFIFYEAYQRLSSPPEVMGSGMLIIALIGLLVNLVCMYWLHSSHTHNLNIKAAYLHVLGDALGSIGVLVAAICIIAFGWNLADPIISIVIAFIILFGSVRILKETVHILMQGTPKHLSIEEIITTISAIEGVESLHDLHVWTLTNGKESLSSHVIVSGECNDKASNEILAKVQSVLQSKFNIHHSTIQIEHEGFAEPNQIIHKLLL